MSKKRKRRRDKQTAMELPERLALTTLPLDPSSVLVQRATSHAL